MYIYIKVTKSVVPQTPLILPPPISGKLHPPRQHPALDLLSDLYIHLPPLVIHIIIQ